MITLIDYGVGNLHALCNVYKRLSIPISVARDISSLRGASKLILPGVGSFDYAMQKFQESGMQEEVSLLVLQNKIPVLGICVGMQRLACSSEEGTSSGLNWIPGTVRKMDDLSLSPHYQLPHMGWNDVRPIYKHPLFLGLEDTARFYFLHSYYFKCNHMENILAESDHGQIFSCAVHKDNIYGVQFHPEKSHHYGVQLLKNFADL